MKNTFRAIAYSFGVVSAFIVGIASFMTVLGNNDLGSKVFALAAVLIFSGAVWVFTGVMRIIDIK